MWTTVKNLFKSRKWLTAAAAFAVATGVICAGWNEQGATEIADKIVNVVTILAAVFMGSTAVEDAAAKFKSK